MVVVLGFFGVVLVFVAVLAMSDGISGSMSTRDADGVGLIFSAFYGSVTTAMIPAIGPRKTAYPPIKARKVWASAKIFHGTITQPPMIAARTHPRLILINLGNMTVMSLAAEIEFAVILVPT